MQCSMAWALHRTEKEKPAAGKTDYWRDFWRSGWDSNPRNLAVQLISSQSRYDHFDTAPYLSQHQHLRKRGELMGRTSKNIKLRIPEKPHKIKGFRSGSYRVATTISSLLCNCDGGVRFGVVSVSPVPAESRLKSGFFALEALLRLHFFKMGSNRLFCRFWREMREDRREKSGDGHTPQDRASTDENLFLRCYKWMYFPSTGTAFPR